MPPWGKMIWALALANFLLIRKGAGAKAQFSFRLYGTIKVVPLIQSKKHKIDIDPARIV
jgi:hypothetical protein